MTTCSHQLGQSGLELASAGEPRLLSPLVVSQLYVPGRGGVMARTGQCNIYTDTSSFPAHTRPLLSVETRERCEGCD